MSPITAASIIELINRHRFRYSDEKELQDGVYRVLKNASIPINREATLDNNDRVDFLVDTIGIEVKIEGGLTPLIRQAQRYLLSDKLSTLIIVTTRTKHVSMPRILNGKTVHVLCLLKL
jgi:hypothetical protein